MGLAKLWRLSAAAAVASTAFGTVYFYVRQYLKDDVWRFDLTLVNKALGVTALLLIALSMGLTAVAYFGRGRARLLAYRKHLGLVGFWTGALHGAVDHFVLPAIGLNAEPAAGDLHADAAGVAALVLFALMAALSVAGVKGRVGGERWRKLLRYAGYAGLVLAVAHAALLKWSSWSNYVRTFDPVLPSLSLPAAVLAAAALLGRLAVWLSARRKP
jgi:DMSO/TMAO reductase YedYZ heme-binding membrane subunit